jgi:CheY-like chemotaxis protein
MTGEAHKVLVVDDDDELRESLTELLAYEGFDVTAARNGREALDYLHEHPRPCLIVLDLMMPVMNGQEFRAEQLRDRQLADIPVVVLTASHDGRRQAEALGATAFFAKPVRLETFFESLRANCC